MTRIKWSHRVQFRVSDQADAMITRLLATGLFGKNRSEVARELFLRSLREIDREKLLETIERVRSGR